MKFPAPLSSVDFCRIQIFLVCISLSWEFWKLNLGLILFFSLFILIDFDVQGLFVCLETESHCVALATLELAM